MAVRSKPHKDLAASFHRLRRMVVDAKSARRSLAAHHGLLADLVSVTLYPSLGESISQPVSASKSPGAPASRRRPDRCPPPPPSPPAKLPQDRGLPRRPPRPVSPPASLPLRSLRLKISAVLSAFLSASTAAKVGGVSGCEEGSSDRRRSLAADAYPGKGYSRPAFWMPLLLAFLCFFLYTGKEVAVVVAVSVYAIMWITRRIRIAVRDFFARDQAFDPASILEDRSENSIRRHSQTGMQNIPSNCKETALFASDSQPVPSGRSLPVLSDPSQENFCSRGAGDSRGIRMSLRAVEVSENFLPTVKLSFIMILALWGLAYSHVIALCLCSCCILVFSVQQELATRMGWRNS